MRLVELVASSIHQIGSLLFQSASKIHTEEEIQATVSFKNPPRWRDLGCERRILIEPIEPEPTLFFHTDYMDYDQYSHGLADVAGYWAEDRILGGIVLFDRGESGMEVGCSSRCL
jgi:hypothetical protein